MSRIYMKVEATGEISEAVSGMIRIARHLDICIQCKFNKVVLIITPDSRSEDVVKKYLMEAGISK